MISDIFYKIVDVCDCMFCFIECVCVYMVEYFELEEFKCVYEGILMFNDIWC